VDVILDFGFWGRSERAEYRSRAAVIGAGTRIHFLDVSDEVLFRRLEARNETLPKGSFRISPQLMREFMGVFEPPTRLELDSEPA
jgi:predicted kinase